MRILSPKAPVPHRFHRSLAANASAAQPGTLADSYVTFSGTVSDAFTGENVILSDRLHVTVHFTEKIAFIRAFIVAVTLDGSMPA